MSEETLRTVVPTVESAAEPRVGDAFVLRRDQTGAIHADCAECGHRYGPGHLDPKLAAVVWERSIADLSSLNAEGMVQRLVARHYFCPACGLLFSVNVQQRDDPVMLEWSFDPPALAALF